MPIFNSESKNLIHQWDNQMKSSVTIKNIATNHPEDRQFTNFTKEIINLTSNLNIQSEKKEGALPYFLLKENITYSALPLEKELSPFLDALSQIQMNKNLSDSILKLLEKIDIPVKLKLYIALQCPHCPDVVRTVIPLALECENIHLHILDGTLFPEMAQKDNVLSAPCLILDNDFRWTGRVQDEEILSMIVHRNPADLSLSTLKTILEQGDANWITEQMIKKGEIFKAFIELLLHETWSVRLGAMVIVEELAEKDPGLAASICPILINHFEQQDTPTKGDILYALGEAGTLETKKWIVSNFDAFDHQDLIDAAQEAIETLESKHE